MRSSKDDDWPNSTFVSADAVSWLLAHLDGIETERDAVDKFNAMIDEQLICHASGDMSHRFINGFYFYSFSSEGESIGY